LHAGIALGSWIEPADPPHPLAVLRTCHERKTSRTAEKRDELAPLHVFPKKTLVQCLKPSTLRRGGE
jgi:hypothetical protein